MRLARQLSQTLPLHPDGGHYEGKRLTHPFPRPRRPQIPPPTRKGSAPIDARGTRPRSFDYVLST